MGFGGVGSECKVYGAGRWVKNLGIRHDHTSSPACPQLLLLGNEGALDSSVPSLVLNMPGLVPFLTFTRGGSVD